MRYRNERENSQSGQSLFELVAATMTNVCFDLFGWGIHSPAK